MNSIIELDELLKIRAGLREQGKKVVFTNGCFDILHAGHVDYLAKAKSLGDILIVAVNSDKSVKEIKGEKRPIIPQEQRAVLVNGLKSVDYVIFFDEPTPANLIGVLIPDILVKGADWDINKVVGKDIVEKNGGKVVTIDFVNNQSTSQIIQSVLERYNTDGRTQGKEETKPLS